MVNQPTRAYALATSERQQVSSLLRPFFVGLTPFEFAGFLGRLSQISAQWLRQTSPAASAFVIRQLVRQLRHSIVVALFGGAGSGGAPEPHGLYATSGVNQVTGIGAPTDYSKFLLGVQKLLESGVPLEIATANVIMNPAVWAKMEGLATGISSDKTQLPRPRALANTRFLVTSSIPPSGSPLRHDAFMGDFRDLLLGIRREASVELVRGTDYAGKLVIDFVGYGRFDYVVLRPKSFCVLEDIAA